MLSLGNFAARDRVGGIFLGLSKDMTEQNGPSLLSFQNNFACNDFSDVTPFVHWCLRCELREFLNVLSGMQQKLECTGYRNLGCGDRHDPPPRVAWARMILRFDSVGTNLVFMAGMRDMPIFCESWISCLPMPILVLCLLRKPGSMQSLQTFAKPPLVI